jgi:large subunit ribosomal protein L18
MKPKLQNKIRTRRTNRVRFKIKSVSKRPRLSIFRSNTHIYAQIIDDANGKTLVSSSSMELKDKKTDKKSNTAKAVGKLLAEKAIKAGVKEAVFDRGNYRYHGRVKALAEAAREGGLKI